jgi:hypothetical protein
MNEDDRTLVDENSSKNTAINTTISPETNVSVNENLELQTSDLSSNNKSTIFSGQDSSEISSLSKKQNTRKKRKTRCRTSIKSDVSTRRMYDTIKNIYKQVKSTDTLLKTLAKQMIHMYKKNSHV